MRWKWRLLLHYLARLCARQLATGGLRCSKLLLHGYGTLLFDDIDMLSGTANNIRRTMLINNFCRRHRLCRGIRLCCTLAFALGCYSVRRSTCNTQIVLFASTLGYCIILWPSCTAYASYKWQRSLGRTILHRLRLVVPLSLIKQLHPQPLNRFLLLCCCHDWRGGSCCLREF